MPASPIRKLVPLADDAKARGIHVYHLNIGQPDLPTPQAAIDAIRNIDRSVLEYSPSQGYRSTRAIFLISISPLLTSGISSSKSFLTKPMLLRDTEINAVLLMSFTLLTKTFILSPIA